MYLLLPSGRPSPFAGPQPSPGSYPHLTRLPGRGLLQTHEKENVVSYSTIAIIVAGIVFGLLILGCRYDHIVIAERQERRFRRWKEQQDREHSGYSPADE